MGIAIHVAHTVFGLGQGTHDFLIQEWIYDAVTASCAAVVLARGVLRPEQRWSWLAIGFGLALWAGADLLWTLSYSRLDEAPFPNAADALYLSGYVGVLIGVAGLARSRVQRLKAIEWTDITIAVLGVSAIGATVVLDYVIENATGTTLEQLVAVGYPVLDLAALAAAAATIALTGWSPGRGLTFVCFGVAAVGLGDVLYTKTSLDGTYTAYAWYNSLWLVGGALIAYASMQVEPSHRISARPESARAFASPMIFAVAVLSFLLLDRLEASTPAVAALMALTLAAIVVRLALTFNENRRLVNLLQRDALTKIGNRSKLLLDMRRIFEDDPTPAHTITFLDLDGFKAYNDAFGHPAGDAVLMRLSGQLAEAVGERGGAYRLGGDEFAVLTPGTTESTRQFVADCADSLTEHGEGFRITSSFGTAEIPREGNNPTAAIALADERMYAHKDSRRPSPGGEVEAVLIRILQARAPDMGDHGSSVARLAKDLGDALGLSEGEHAALARGAELHDIGKMAIPDAILTKPGALSEEEWDFIRQHTLLGERILSAAPSLAAVGKLVRSSHERWDGRGYPDGLQGDEIPLASRIIFVCDAYDAMVSDRPYAAARSHEEALEELRAHAGAMFDPEVVEKFAEMPSERFEHPPLEPHPGVESKPLTPTKARDVMGLFKGMKDMANLTKQAKEMQAQQQEQAGLQAGPRGPDGADGRHAERRQRAACGAERPVRRPEPPAHRGHRGSGRDRRHGHPRPRRDERYNLDIDLEVHVPGRAPYRVANQYIVPAAAQLGPGVTLPIRVDASDQSKIAIDWDQAARSPERGEVRPAGSGAAAPAAPAAAPAASGGGDTVAELERLAKLRDSGALSDAEFEQQKARVLGS